jgi:SPP1 family predicted phage head-tail adaptor
VTTCSPPRRSGPRLSDFTHRARIEAPAASADDAGGATLTWTLVAEVYVGFRASSGSERLDADRLSGRVTHTISLRHRSWLTPAHRFVMANRIFDIRAVLDREGRRRFLECHCEEIVT